MSCESEGGRRFRARLRGAMSTRSGKAIGLASVASLAAPVVGFIVRDLGKPDSVLRALTQRAVAGLLAGRTRPRQEVDITDKVGVTQKD